MDTLYSILEMDKDKAGWALQLCLVLVLTVLASSILQRLLRRMPAGDAGSSFRLAFIASAATPLRFAVWLEGLYFAAEILLNHFGLETISYFAAAKAALHIGIFCWFLLRLKHHLFALYGARSRMNLSTRETLEKTTGGVIIAAAVLMILPTFGISINGILAFGGIGGIIVGLAAKDILSNFFSAIMLHIDRPFAVGEWIALPEKGIEGTVEHIGWRQVSLRTLNRRLLFIPNAMFSTLLLENPARMTHRRIKETIGVRYSDIGKVPAILADISSYLKAHSAIDQKEAILVHLDTYGSYSVDLMVSAFTRETAIVNFSRIKEEVLLEIAQIVARHGADFAFPTQTLYVNSPQAA